MKLFTSKDQTTKLIGVGFEKPKSEVKAENAGECAWYNPAYSIGELIEMLPTTIEHEIWWGKEKGMGGWWGLQISTNGTDFMWTVDYVRDHSAPLYGWDGSELIDALFDAVITLKEERVI